MNNPLISSATLIILAVITVILINFIINKLFANTIKYEDNKLSFSLLKAGVIFSFFTILIAIKIPYYRLIDIIASTQNGSQLNLNVISYLTLFLFIGFIIFSINYLITSFLYKIILNGESLVKSLKENIKPNILLFCSILLGFCFLSQSIYPDILDLIIPFPKTPIFR